MSVPLKYVGASTRYFDTVDGSREQWTPGRVSDVADAAAVALIQTGQFAAVAGAEARYTAAQLSALAAAGGLTQGAEYLESDSLRRRPAVTASRLAFGDHNRRGRRVMGIKPAGDAVSTGSSLATAKTWFIKIGIPADFDAIQLVMYRHDTSVGSITYKAIIAATELATGGATDGATIDDKKYQPWVGNASLKAQGLDSATLPGGWRSVTWAGAASKDIAPPTSQYDPTYAVSDVIQCASVPSVDGNACRYLMIRLNTALVSGTPTIDYAPASLAGAGGDLGIGEAADSINGGQVLQGFFTNDAGGVYVSTPQSWTPPANFTQTIPCFGLIVHTRERAITVMGIGDSITQVKDAVTAPDVAAHDRVSGFIRRACVKAQASSGVPFGFVNHGIASQNTSIYQPSGLAKLTVWKPDVVVYSPWTPNYGPFGSTTILQLVIERFRRYLAEMRQQCELSSSRLVIWTGLPTPSTTIGTSAIDNLRKAINAEWVAQTGNAQATIDLSDVIGDGASPERYAVAYGAEAYPNALHPTLAGHEVMALALADLLVSVAAE